MANALIDNFESYSLGNLNGQGGWSGDTHFQVENSVVNTGTQAVSSAPNGGVAINSPNFTAVASSTQYFYWFTTNASNQCYVAIRRPSPTYTEIGVIGFGVRSAGVKTLDIWDQTGAHYVDTGFTVADSTWYAMAIQWDIGNSRYRCSIDGGATWCSYATIESANNPGSILIGGPSVTGTSYWDDFSDTAPSSTSIKTVTGLAKASVKTIPSGLAIASVKSINGLT